MLDEIDHRILSVLQKDASLSLDALADAVHLSRNACWRRMKNLEATGVIKKRVALIDPAKVGRPLSVFVHVRTQNHDEAWLKEFERAINGMPEIVGAYRMSGDLDYVLRVRVADVAGYDHFYKRLIGKVSVSDISASFVMEEIKDTTEIPV